MEIRLLLVDDEDLTREGLLHYVEWGNLGITHIKAASNGIQALKIASEFEPAFFLRISVFRIFPAFSFPHKAESTLPPSIFLLLAAIPKKEI